MRSKQKLIPYLHAGTEKWDHFFVDPVSEVIYFVKKHNGKRIKFSTKEKVPNGVKAKRFANVEFDLRTGKRKRQVNTLIDEELDLYLAFKESEGHASDTMNNTRRARRQIGEFWGKKFPYEINRDNLVLWYAWWQKHYPDIQMENAVKYMRNFCKYLAEKTVNERPLLPAVPKISDPNHKQIRRARKRKKERIITPEDFKLILATAENPEHALLVSIMYTMATRISETLAMEFGTTIFLNEDPPVYRWFDGQNKADLDGFHALPTALVASFKSLCSKRRGEKTDLLFPQLFNNQAPLKEQQIDWQAWRDRAGLDHHWTPHTFRHTCLTNLFNNPKNPQAVICKQYRVSLQVALDTYVKITRDSMLAIRDAIEIDL
jgi:integrase